MRVFFFISLLTSIHVSLLSNPVIAVDPNKGFSMKIIHMNSKESPLYVGDNLTRVEKLQRLAKQSKAQAIYIESQILLQSNATRSMVPDDIQMPAVYEASGSYVAKVGLGTFRGGEKSFMDYYLIIDTGSDQTWLQCEGATKTFNQDMPLYPWSLSTTYRHVPCNGHPYCFRDKCNAYGQCTYSVRYGTGSVSSGIVATEKFTFGSNTGGVENIELQIGCGLSQENFDVGDNHLKDKPNLITGILGLGKGQLSFVNQLAAAGQGKFSHCFETYNKKLEGSNTYLRFGAAATIGGAFQKVYVTPLVETTFETPLYYLNLEDISVGNNRVRFPTGTFKVKLEDGQMKGGAIIDSGSTFSMLHKDHFDRVADLVKAHFNRLGVEYIGSQYNYDVCFRLRGRFDNNNYPSITLHFQQADYIIQDYKASFLTLTREIVCLGIMQGYKTRGPTFILGAMQQTNKRILYNLNDLSLSFATEHCELDS
ncbi:aspartic proteinase nepenthesin-2-like [Papaver somniferum]|uniref:aspartic proteinase nepenthesin-2-like n=1 Tax=Papaver somniferum TaxID=3469 RepID=UPI000E6F9F53|nr:aspartic proteinase nepenthesin-2-like [Papaver somniferum]